MLVNGYSRKAIGKNIATEEQTKPRDQAIAIALNTARRAKRKAKRKARSE